MDGYAMEYENCISLLRDGKIDIAEAQQGLYLNPKKYS